ncbi:MAG TPA: hypothetical protein VF717_09445 [Pyrinomonadaceae bacterium]|jgi:hypothetical protein
MSDSNGVLPELFDLIKSGYAGTLPNGNIVDRREFPEAVPVAKNSLFGAPEPLPIKCSPEDCKHLNFMAQVNVARIMDEGVAETEPASHYFADITVSCDQCGMPFHFVGLPFGLSPHEPMASPDGLEARMPIKPGPLPVCSGKARFDVF